MRGSAGLWVLLAALLGAAAAALLLLGPREDAGELEDLATRASEQAAPSGPMLAGQARAAARDATDAQAPRRLRGTVEDAVGRPVAGVRVTARRLEAATGHARGGWDPAQALRRAYAETLAPAAQEPIEAAATSDAEGGFEVVVRAVGRIRLGAEPAPPQVGTQLILPVAAEDHEPVVLRVLGGSALRGRVIDAEGRGVAAQLRASWSAPSLGAWAAGATATDAGTGAFLFPAVPDGKLTVEVLLAGRGRFTAPTVTTPTSEELVIRVGADVPLLRGRVVTRAGQPVAGALVAASVQRAQPLAPEAGPAQAVYARYYAESDADGAFTLLGALGGPLTQLEATAPGFLHHTSSPPLATWSGVALGPAAAGSVEIVLFQGGTLAGRVTEKGTGRPLAEVEVRAAALALDARVGSPAPTLAVTDAQGRYLLEGVPLGRSVLQVRHASHHLPLAAAARGAMDMVQFVDGNVVYGMPQAGVGAPTVFIETEGQRVTRDLELEAGVPLSGRVVGPDGAPVAGAKVLRTDGSDGMYYPGGMFGEAGGDGTLATSDAEGRFHVAGIPANKALMLAARKAPWVGVRCEPFVHAAEAPAKEIVLRLERGGSLRGIVLDEHGVPVEGLQVQGWPESPDGAENGAQARTRADGTFLLEGLGAGTWNVNAWSEDGRGGFVQVKDLGAGESREGVEVRLAGSVTLAGVLVDEQGQPAAHKELSAHSPQGGVSGGMSDGDGRFRFHGISKGPQQLFAGSWGGPRLPLGTFDAPAEDLKVVWKEPPHAVIEGTVLDAQGRSVPMCQVRIRPGPPSAAPAPGAPAPASLAVPAMMPANWGGMGGGSTVVNGWFRQRVGGEPPFQVTVSLPQDTEGRPLNLRSTTVTVADLNAGPITIRLEPGLEVAGRVVDGGGRGVADVGVSVAGIRTNSDAEGAFAVGGLAEGTHKVQVQPVPPWVRPPEISAAAGTRDLLIRLASGLPVAGTLRQADGRAITNGHVSVQWPKTGSSAAGQIGANPDAQGRFRVQGVPPEVVVSVHAQAWTQAGGTVPAPRTLRNVRPGTEDLEIVLGAGARVSGAVVDAAGRPVKGGFVELRVGTEAPPTVQHVPLQEDGTFAIEGLEPGPLELRFVPQDGGLPGEMLRTEAPAAGVRLVVPERQPIRGRLAGVEGAGARWRVWAWAQDDPTRRVGGSSIDADGAFTLGGVSGKGPWMVAARCDDDDRYALGGPYEGGAEGIVLLLRQGRAIEGTVVPGPGGSLPSGGTRVSVTSPTWSARVTSDASGAFRVRGVPPGRYALSARGADGSFGEQVKDVADGATGVRVPLK